MRCARPQRRETRWNTCQGSTAAGHCCPCTQARRCCHSVCTCLEFAAWQSSQAQQHNYRRSGTSGARARQHRAGSLPRTCHLQQRHAESESTERRSDCVCEQRSVENSKDVGFDLAAARFANIARIMPATELLYSFQLKFELVSRAQGASRKAVMTVACLVVGRDALKVHNRAH